MGFLEIKKGWGHVLGVIQRDGSSDCSPSKTKRTRRGVEREESSPCIRNYLNCLENRRVSTFTNSIKGIEFLNNFKSLQNNSFRFKKILMLNNQWRVHGGTSPHGKTFKGTLDLILNLHFCNVMPLKHTFLKLIFTKLLTNILRKCNISWTGTIMVT